MTSRRDTTTQVAIPVLVETREDLVLLQNCLARAR